MFLIHYSIPLIISTCKRRYVSLTLRNIATKRLKTRILENTIVDINVDNFYARTKFLTFFVDKTLLLPPLPPIQCCVAFFSLVVHSLTPACNIDAGGEGGKGNIFSLCTRYSIFNAPAKNCQVFMSTIVWNCICKNLMRA